jgi:hypothetical protein
MVLKIGTVASEQASAQGSPVQKSISLPRVSLPWESIDPSDQLAASESEKSQEEGGKWFTNSPPGEWEMDGAAGVAATDAPEDSAEDSAEDSRGVSATPFDALSGYDEIDSEKTDPDHATVGEEEPALPGKKLDGGGWTVAILCMGLGLIAACIVIPQADVNRRLVYEREQLKLDLTQVQKQIALNKEFLLKMESDPQLTERLAQREMRTVKQGEAVVAVNSSSDSTKAGSSAEKMSPFGIVNVPPPAKLAPYQPVGGMFAQWCRDPGSHMYVLGAGMLLVAIGLTLGGSNGGVPKASMVDRDDDDESLDTFVPKQ